MVEARNLEHLKRIYGEARADGLVADFPTLAHNVANELQNSAILLYPGIGHAPQIEIPDQFHADLVRFLKSDPVEPASEWE